ncbi:MAG: PAS domain-containing protein [Cyanobacteriota/Melainabacteria group bacterium]
MKVLVYGKNKEKLEQLKKIAGACKGTEFEFCSELEKQEKLLERLRYAHEYDLVLLPVSKDDEGIYSLLGILTSEAADMPLICLLSDDDEEEALKLIQYGAAEVIFASEITPDNLTRVTGRVRARALKGGQLQSKMSDFVLTNSFDGIVALDLHGRVMLWNRSMERMFSRSGTRYWVKSPPMFCLSRESPGRSRGAGWTVLCRGQKVFVSREQRRHYQPFYAPLTSRTGSIIGVMGIFRDLTEIAEREAVNTELNARLEKVADSIPQMLWFANSFGERNFFNKKYLDFAGAKASHLLDEGWLMAVQPEQRAVYSRVLKEAVEKKQGFHIEYQMKNKDNVYRRVMDSCAPLTGEGGKFLGLIGYCTDVSATGTTMHRMDAISASSTRSFSDISGKRRRRPTQISSTMENAPLGVWKLDRDLNILTVSRSAAAQLGSTPEDLYGKKFTDIVRNISEDSLYEVMNERSSFQLNAHEIEMTGGKVGKDDQYWDVAAWPLLDRTKDVIGVCLSTIEVEGRSEDKGKEAFVATLVHDLKTPLIGADRTLEMLIEGAMGDVEDAQSEVLSMLQRSNRGLLRMVQNLIEVYRYDFAKPRFDLVSTSLFDIALDCVNELSALAEEKKVNLEANLIEGHGIVAVDEIAVKRVIINLIDNAIKFTPQGGRVRVWGEETPNTVTIFVKDSGIGISQDEIPRVFDKFWRSPTNTGQAVGTGLGLYLCKQVIDAHHGEITVVPGQSEGTLMRISFNT